MGGSACEQKSQGKIDISYNGRFVVDEKLRVLGEFNFVNNTPSGLTILSLFKDGSGYFCLHPQFEYKEEGKWEKIEVSYAGAVDPIIIQPHQKFVFIAPMESLYQLSQKHEYRILVDEHASAPFAFTLSDKDPSQVDP